MPQILPLHLLQRRLHPDRPLLEHLPVPHLDPALGRVAEHRHPVRARAEHLRAQALLRAPAVRAEDERARLGREQPRERAGERELLRLAEEVEEGRGVDRGHAPAQRVQRREPCQRERERGLWERGARGQGRRDREVRGVEGVPRDERHREALRARLEELVAELPELYQVRGRVELDRVQKKGRWWAVNAPG